MKNLIIFIILCLTVFSACKKNNQQIEPTDNLKWKFETLSEKKELFLDADSTKAGMKLNLEFTYPSELNNDSILKVLQSSFVRAFAGEEYITMPPKIAFDNFLRKNVEECMELGKMAGEDGPDFSYYYKNIKTSVVDTNNIIITVKTDYQDYTGGAHGAYLTTFYNIDIRNGGIVTEKELFKNNSTDKLTDLINEALKDTITNGKSITVLYPESVEPNSNFYFNKEGIVYVFNTYEIAPYSDGIIELCVPYYKIKGLITPEYAGLIK